MRLLPNSNFKQAPAGAGALRHYQALDSWRGICACLVVLFHFEAYSHFYNLPLIRNAYLFVDFFFVLSGFVITASYRQRLLHGYPLRKYMLLRFGRVYPLHFFMLACFFALYLFTGLQAGTQPLIDRHALASLAANILLLHSLHTMHSLTWNWPSWSISVEFYTYLVFAFGLRFGKTYVWAMEAAIIVAAPIFLALTHHHNMDINYDWGIVRCLFGFCLGGLVYRLHRTTENRCAGVKAGAATAAEVVIVFAAAALVSFFGQDKLSILSPFLFAILIYIFALERGALSQLLRRQPFLTIGLLSYTIYMIHDFLFEIVYAIAAAAERRLGVTLFAPPAEICADHRCLGPHLWQGDLLSVEALALVLGCSVLIHRAYERPAYDWFKSKAAKIV